MVCLVGRELCLFTTVDASKAPTKQRKEFAAMAVRRLAPFADADFDAAWSADGTVAIWYWSRSRIAALASSEQGRRKRFVAEAPHVGSPRTEGVELLQLVEGFEARAWKAGHLQASRWWPELPAADQWRDFLRGTGQIALAQPGIPESVTAPIAASPWNRAPSSTEKLQLSGLDQYLPRVALALAMLFLVLAGGQIGSIARAQLDIWRAQSAANDLDAPLKRILDAREATDKASAEVSQLLALQALRPTISLMAEFTRLMAGKDWQVTKWNQPTPDTLEVNLLAPGSNPEELVSSWEASPMFKGVTTELGRDNELTIKATVTPPPGRAGTEAP
ncbi:hypothetical protein [Stenotrophomonas nitritireducens]|uniref:hypothetical protein n=1 Tax=Stenotrophomonas nitritireducens TaxID=83617 RepID=UPI003D97D799